MIKVNGFEVAQESFGDGSLKCNALSGEHILFDNEIWWLYDNDAELFTLQCIVKDIQNRRPSASNALFMPYIPHARQDRFVSGRLFTLKYFAQIINSLNFDVVAVLDPHSNVSTALIDRVVEMQEDELLDLHEMSADAIMFPDDGACKKYYIKGSKPIIVGKKRRNYEGRIESYELSNFVDGVKHVVIRDDICSYGGTFVAAAKELRSRGVEKVTLVVSHCENNILKGEVFDYIDEVLTTDSICTVEHPKLHYIKQYRQE